MSQPEEFRDFVLNHQFDQLAKGQDGRAIIFLEEDEYRGMQSIMAEAASPGSLNAALELLADIRAAAGDPDGKMMQTELVQHIAEIRERAELWGQESDHFRDGTKMIPAITNDMKAECMGEFSFMTDVPCGECLVEGEDKDCEVCEGELTHQQAVTVPWDTCKKIYKRMARLAPTHPHTKQPDRDTVAMPQNVEQARAMALIGTKWLLDNAPAELVKITFPNVEHIQTLKKILVDSVATRKPDFIIGAPENQYLIRYWLRRDRSEGSIYLHCILKSDDDRALHDHPWPSTSIVLQGTLREILPNGSRLLTPGSITSRSAEQAHRLEVVDGPVWTLFITGAVEREWGFHCPNGWVHWKDFTDPGTNGQQIGKGCGDQ